MKKINNVLLAGVLAVLVIAPTFALTVNSVFATNANVSDKPTTPVIKPPAAEKTDLANSALGSPAQIYDNIITYISWAYTIVIALAFLYTAIEGIKYITAGGDSEKSIDAKQGIMYGLIGIALIIGVGFMIAFVGHILGLDISATTFIPWS